MAHGYPYRTRIRLRVHRRLSRPPSGIVLTTFELTEASSTFVAAPVTIVWGVGLLLCGAAVLSQMNVLPGKYLATEGDFASFSTGWSTVFLAGFVGTVLGVLARLGVSSTQLVVAAVIVHCGFMVISSNASLRMPILAATDRSRSGSRSDRTRIWSDPAHGIASATMLHRIAADIPGEICR